MGVRGRLCTPAKYWGPPQSISFCFRTVERPESAPDRVGGVYHLAKPPRPPLKRSFVTFDRGGQTGPPRSNDFFFGAADDTRAADNRPAGRLAERLAERQAEFLGFRVFGTVIDPLSCIALKCFSKRFLKNVFFLTFFKKR